MPDVTLTMRGITLVPGTSVPRERAFRVSKLTMEYGVPTLDVFIQDDSSITPEDEDYTKLSDVNSLVIFSGKVKQVRTGVRPVERPGYRVVCQGWEAVLESLPVTVARTFVVDTPDAYMIKVLLDDNYGPISTSDTPVLRSYRADMPAMTFAVGGDGKGTLGNALRRVFEKSGASFFRIDGDKNPHYNDVEDEAPYVLVMKDGNNVSTANIQGRPEHYQDSTNRPLRIRVVGNAGVEFTATDWMRWNEVRRKMTNEPGTPSERFLELPDEVDIALLSSDSCAIRAWQRLLEYRRSPIVTVTTRAHGFRPGQLVAIHSENLPPLLDKGDFHAEPNGLVYPHAYADLHKTGGWLQIQNVAISVLDQTRIVYVIEAVPQAGSPQPTFEDAINLNAPPLPPEPRPPDTPAPVGEEGSPIAVLRSYGTPLGTLIRTYDWADGTLQGWTSEFGGSISNVAKSGIRVLRLTGPTAAGTVQAMEPTSAPVLANGEVFVPLWPEVDGSGAGKFDSMMLTFRVQDRDNLYLARIVRPTNGANLLAEIHKKVAGVPSVLASHAFARDTFNNPSSALGYGMLVRFSNKDIAFFVDSTLMLQMQDSTYSSGRIGMQANTLADRPPIVVDIGPISVYDISA